MTTLHLTTGLPGTGKTTLAKRIEASTGALRLTPDEWMQPLFGESDAGGKRDVLEGRLIWVAHRVLLTGGDVILDFGCWSPEERFALRAMAQLSGADWSLHFLTLPEEERRARAVRRWETVPHETFEMSAADHDRFLACYRPPTVAELTGSPVPAPPAGFATWPAWAADLWPSLPDLGEDSGI